MQQEVSQALKKKKKKKKNCDKLHFNKYMRKSGDFWLKVLNQKNLKTKLLTKIKKTINIKN